MKEAIDNNHTEAFGKKPANISGKNDMHKAQLVAEPDVEEGEISANYITADGVLNNEQYVVVQSQNSGEQLNLTLHNSFELLENDSEHVIGEAKPSDEESNPIILDMQMDKNPNVGDNSLGKQNLTHSTSIEVLVPSSLDQPSATSVSFGEVMDPIFYETTILQPTVSPITTNDEILGQDKRKVQITVGPKNKSTACLRDGKVLSKFWGDEETDASDNTVDSKTDSEVNKAKFPNATSRKSKKLGGTSSLNESLLHMFQINRRRKTNCRVLDDRKISAFKPVLRVAFLKLINHDVYALV